MPFPSKELTTTTQREELPLLVLLPLIITIIVGFIAWYGLRSVKHTVQEHIAHDVQNTLKAAQAGLHLWRGEQAHEVQSWADLPEVRAAITTLARRTAVGEVTTQSLLQSKELQQLRILLGPFTQKKQHIGFVAFDQSGLQIAALLDKPVGKHNLSQQSDFVKKALTGETVVSIPFPSTIVMPNLTDMWERNQPTMFAAAPVRDETGVIIGALGFRLRPNLGFSEILQTFQNGETGKTYAFNAEGLMLSESRFLPHLKQTGLLPADTETAILNVHIRDPGPNLLDGLKAPIPPEQHPLTRMAASAVTGQTDLDLKGYRDYRGISVIGTWIWLEHYGFGLASEMDISEAYDSLDEIRIIFFGIIGLLISGSIISGGVFLKERRESRERKLAELVMRRYEQVVSGSDGFLAFIDTEYKYRAINTPYLKAFGKTGEEILGKTGETLFGAEVFDTVIKPAQTQCLNGEYVTCESWENFPARGRRCLDVHYIPFKESDNSVTGIIVAVRDITERKQMEQQLRYAQFAMDQTDDSVYWVGKDAQILYANKAACTKLGYTHDELISLTVFDINPNLLKEDWPNLWRNIREHHSLLFESQHRTKDGSVFPIEINVTHLDYEGQSYNYSVVRDITERKKHEQQLLESEARYRTLNEELEQRVNKRTEELQFANKELEAFSYSVSHDLRAPLRAINGFGKALLDDYGHKLNVEGQHYLTMIREQAQTMGTLIDDLLNFSRLSRKDMNLATIDMTMLFRDVFQTAETQQDHDRILQINIGSLSPAQGDRSLLTHAIENLVTNALKFTSGKSTTVIDVNSRIEGSEVVYSIKDNGVGFNMAYVDKLFVVFQRLHSQEEFEGTGVGLALVQRIIRRHGGRVWAEGKVNEGATFYFALPSSE